MAFKAYANATEVLPDAETIKTDLVMKISAIAGPTLSARP
jgi:hypothetical protein